MMSKLEIYDPPMCCKTGICGSNADPVLVRFASDLEWVKAQGIEVTRHVLSLEPEDFSRNETVKTLINKEGKGCLPILLFDDVLASKACYPDREKLAKICGVQFNEDEAPPIHREENCCCGVDCDCRLPQGEKGSLQDSLSDTSKSGTSWRDVDFKKSILTAIILAILVILAIELFF